jgi:hypothetical protein
VIAILFCADPLAPRRVDDHFAEQAELVRSLGGTVALIDHDAVQSGRIDDAVRRVPRDIGRVWYRGWMVSSDAYQNLTTALASRGVEPATSADAYRTAHEFPGSYATFAEVTPPGEWTVETDDVAGVLGRLALGPGPAIVKDFVKSHKHEWDEACFIPSLADLPAATRVVSRFLELQGDDLAGGLVLRGFEEFTGPQARVWWVDSEPVLVTAHPDTPDAIVTPELDHIAPCVRALDCRFITTDVARRADGVWRVIEVGDGQVSDLPAGVDATVLFQTLLAALAG